MLTDYETTWRTAAALGTAAFKRGAKAIPAHDAAMMATLKGRPIGDPRTVPQLKAWAQGWHKANLAASVEGRL